MTTLTILKITLGLILYCAVSLIVFKVVKRLLKGQSVPYKDKSIRCEPIGPAMGSKEEQKILDKINQTPLKEEKNDQKN